MDRAYRLQHATLTLDRSETGYVLNIATSGALPMGFPSIRAAMDYVTNVDLDGLGSWEIVGGMDKQVLLERVIHQIETREVVLQVNKNGFPEYGFDTKGGFVCVSSMDSQGIGGDKTPQALRTAIDCLNIRGWALDSVIDPWKAPPASFWVWRPQGVGA